MASGHVNRIKRPNTWLHRPMLRNVKKALANPEPSTHGTFRTYRDVRRESAFQEQSGSWISGRSGLLFDPEETLCFPPCAICGGIDERLNASAGTLLYWLSDTIRGLALN